jgi:hypothetical protein
MPRRKLRALARILFLAASGAVAAGAFAGRPRRGDVPDILIEAESAPALADRASIQVDGSASGGRAVRIGGWSTSDPNYGRRVAGETVYTVEIRQKAHYYVWIRAWWSGTCMNSATVLVRPTLDGAPLPEQRAARYLAGNDETFNQWHWVAGPHLDLEPGRFEALVGTRETSTVIDCLLLTTSPDEPAPPPVPAGTAETDGEHGGAVAFRERFVKESPDPEYLARTWISDGPPWEVFSDVAGFGGAGCPLATRTVAYANTRSVAQASIEATMLLTDRGGGGIVFGRSGPSRYYVVRLAAPASGFAYAGLLEVARIDGDLTTSIAAVPVEVRPWTWFKIDASIADDLCRVRIDDVVRLDALLGHDTDGQAGLWSDGPDPLFEPHESPERLEPTRDLATAGHVPSRTDAGAHWPGICTAVRGGEAVVARWINISKNPRCARGLEIVRAESGCEAKVLRRIHRAFSWEDRDRMRLRRAGSRVELLVGDESITEVDAPADALLGAVVAGYRPRVYFGSFALRTLGITPRTASAQEGSARGVGGLLEIPPYTAYLGISTLVLEREHLPCRTWTSTAPDGTTMRLHIAEAGAGKAVVSVEREGADPLAHDVPLADRLVLQLLYGAAEVRVFAGGVELFSVPRALQSMGDLRLIWEGARRLPPIVRSANGTWTPSFLTKGPMSDRGGERRLTGNGVIEIHGDPRDWKSWTIELYGGDGGSGYRAEIDFDRPRRFSFYRDGARVSHGAFECADENVEAHLFHLGRSVMLELNYENALAILADDRPRVQGFVRASGTPRSKDATPLGVVLRQAWDLASVFHFESVTPGDLLPWRPHSGEWRMDRPENDRVSGHLCGRILEGGAAELVHESKDVARELLLELAVVPESMRPGDRLVVVFEDDGGAPAADEIALSWTVPGDLVWSMRRNGVEARGRSPLDPHASQITLTILRGRQSLDLELENAVLGSLASDHGAAIRRVRLRLEGASGSTLRLRSSCVQYEPLDARRLPRDARTQLDFLRALVLRDAARPR